MTKSSLSTLFSLFLPLFAWAQHPNVLIGTNLSPNEPSICVNPKNTQELVAGANLANLYYSHDGGENWTQTAVSCPWGIWGDPVISVDTSGNFLYLHLSNPPGGNWIDRIIVQKSSDAGQSWNTGTFTGLNGTKAQDKHWIAVDPKSNKMYVTWTQFDNYGSFASTDSSIILFSKSSDGGNSWTTAKRISKLAGDCVDSDDTAEGAVPCVGPNGEIYVAWANQNKIWFDRSLDGGANWLQQDVFVADQPGGWDFAIPGIYRANGLPITACDQSNGPHKGTIYVNWSDQRHGESDTDVWLAKSTDGGSNWSAPIRVNDDGPGKQQFFTWMTIDQATGWLWFVFYDRRHYNDERTDVYMALSKDGGATFNNFKVSESPFSPTENVFFGDYTNVTAHNNVVRPIWTRLDNGDLSVWTALIQADSSAVATKESMAESFFSLENPAPNPFSDFTNFAFKLRQNALVSLSVADLMGKTCLTIIDNEWRNPGKYIERIQTNQLGQSSGAYFIVLRVNGLVTRRKVIMEH